MFVGCGIKWVGGPTGTEAPLECQGPRIKPEKQEVVVGREKEREREDFRDAVVSGHDGPRAGVQEQVAEVSKGQDHWE